MKQQQFNITNKTDISQKVQLNLCDANVEFELKVIEDSPNMLIEGHKITNDEVGSASVIRIMTHTTFSIEKEAKKIKKLLALKLTDEQPQTILSTISELLLLNSLQKSGSIQRFPNRILLIEKGIFISPFMFFDAYQQQPNIVDMKMSNIEQNKTIELDIPAHTKIYLSIL